MIIDIVQETEELAKAIQAKIAKFEKLTGARVRSVSGSRQKPKRAPAITVLVTTPSGAQVQV